MFLLCDFPAYETDNYIASVTNLHVHSTKDIVLSSVFYFKFQSNYSEQKRRGCRFKYPQHKGRIKSREKQQDTFLSRLCCCVKVKPTEVVRLIIFCYLCHLQFWQAHRCDNRAFRSSVGVPFCNCTGVITMTLAATVCFSRRGVPSVITIWVIWKRGYVFNLTQLFKTYILAAKTMTYMGYV